MIKIGTNFLYNSKNFLDLRQGEADSLEDLKTWNINIPVGFEVCVNGVWYVYNPDFEDEITGHFKKRVDVELTSSTDFNNIYDQVTELQNTVFPLTLSVSTGQSTTNEMGSTIIPSLSWTITRKGVQVLPTEAYVNDSTTGVSSDMLSYLGSRITTDTNYLVKVNYGNLSATKNIFYVFRLKKYYGVSTKETLTNSDILALANSTWATNWTMTATNFDCSGGKYPYYVIPSDLYDPSTFKIWIGGLRNTDFIATPQEVTNSNNYTSSYMVIRLNTKQTGILSIRFGD